MNKLITNAGFPLLCTVLLFSGGCGYQRMNSPDSYTQTPVQGTTDSRTYAGAKTIQGHGGAMGLPDYLRGETEYQTNARQGSIPGSYRGNKIKEPNSIASPGDSVPFGKGASSNLEAKLHAVGFHSIRILVLDNTIIMGQNSKRTTEPNGITGTASTEGNGTSSTAKGNASGTDLVSPRDQGELNRAADYLRSQFGANARILLVQNEQAVTALERIKSNLAAGNYGDIQEDMDILLFSALRQAR